MATRKPVVLDSNNQFETLQTGDDNLFTGYGLVRYTTTSVDYTAVLTDDVILVDTSGGEVTITLPSLEDADGKFFTIKRLGGADNVIVVPDGTDLIQGEVQKILNVAWWGMDILATSSGWIII